MSRQTYSLKDDLFTDALDDTLHNLDQLGLAAGVVDGRGMVVTATAAAADLLGLSVEELVGRPAVALGIRPAEGEATIDELVRQLLRDGSLAARVVLPRSAGQLTEAELRASLTGDPSAPGTLVVMSPVPALLSPAPGRPRDDQAERRSTALAAVFDSLQAHVAVLDERGVIVAVNRSWEEFGRSEGLASDSLGANYLAVCRASDDPLALEVAAGLQALLDGVGDELNLEYPCHSPTQQRWFLLRAVRSGSPPLIVVYHRDITQLRESRAQSALQRALLNEVDAGVIATDIQLRVVSWNDGAERLYGWTREEAMGRALPDLVLPNEDPPRARPSSRRPQTFEREQVLRRKDGTRFPVLVHTTLVPDLVDGGPGWIGVSVDLTERRAADAQLRRARDQLAAVTENMGEGLFTLDQERCLTYMNCAGRELLGWAPEEIEGLALETILRPPDETGTPAHDWVQGLLNGAPGEPPAPAVGEDSFLRRDGTPVTVSYTAAPFRADDGTEGCLVLFRDITAQKVEQQRVQYDLEKLAWIERMQDALEEDRFVLHAQPITDLRDGSIIKRELLLRMLAPPGVDWGEGLVLPGRFLPVAEEYGFITELDRWVVGRAAEIAATGLPVAVNVSARSISDATFMSHVRSVLKRTAVDPTLLVFEITETALIDNELAARAFVKHLHRMGCRVALDDFGTGYGTLSYLKHLPLDFLKIDIEFVRDLKRETASRNVVEAVVSLAQRFELQTVAEGVEDEETLELLRALGVDHAQGYYLGRPGPLDS